MTMDHSSFIFVEYQKCIKEYLIRFYCNEENVKFSQSPRLVPRIEILAERTSKELAERNSKDSFMTELGTLRINW